MEQVKLYDTTLRDGMQGEGMSLSAAEKVRVVRCPRQARRAVDRGRLSELQSEGGRALRLARRGRAPARDDLRLRDDPPARDLAAAEDPALRTLVELLCAGRHPGRQDLGASTWRR